MKKAAFIIAFNDFQDQEYFSTKQILEKSGIKVFTFSDQTGVARGSYGGEVKVDGEVDALEVSVYDAIIFIGGGGASRFIEDFVCHKICKEAIEKNKILAAICIAPAILAKSGVLKRKKATVWTNLMDKSAVKILKDGGADYTSVDVEVDGRIVTADGPASAEKFGKAISDLIK